MPKPITMTEDMIAESFADIRKKFEEAYAKAYADAKAGKKLADGKFEFKFNGINWTWGDNKDRARLTIDTVAYLKMTMMVQKTDKEVGWHGAIERDPEDKQHFILRDVYLFPQKVTGTTVVTDDDKYSDWVQSLPDEIFFKNRFHGHSHVNMGVTPSCVDMDYRRDMLGQFNDGFYVFLIINKREDVSCQIYDFDNNMLYDDKEIDVELGGELAEQLEADTKKYVQSYTYQSGTKTTTQASSGSSKGKGYKSYDYYDYDYENYGFPPYYDPDLKRMVYPNDPEYVWGC